MSVQSPSVGLDAATITLDDGTRIETPMRAIQGGYYARTLKLWSHLGASRRVIDFDYSLHRAGTPLLIYNGANGLRYDPVSRPSTQAWLNFLLNTLLLGITYLFVLFTSLYHLYCGHYPNIDHILHRTTLREWCRRRRLPGRFLDTILLPLFACVCTAPIEDVEQTPAADVLGASSPSQILASRQPNARTEYIAKTFGADHYLTDMSAVSHALLHHLPSSNRHFGVRITSLSLDGRGIAVETEDGASTTYDHVVSCLPAPTTARLSRTLAKALDAQNASTSEIEAERARSELLLRFPTRSANVINHVDDQGVRLPCRMDRRILNLDLPSTRRGHVAATHVIDRNDAGKGHVYQTTTPCSTSPLNPKAILSETTFERAIVTLDSRAALKELWTVQGDRGLWLAGSWCASGIPLLEGCVVSAERVVERIWRSCGVDAKVPW